ncbi:hypothetical protein R6Q59_005845 [Mikania micrantha]
MADVARSHGGDGGNDPPHGHHPTFLTGCQASKPKKTRLNGRNLNLHVEFQRNGNKPLSIEYDTTEQQFRPVGEYYQMFVRLLSNEIGRHVPYYYGSWKNVTNQLKRSIFITVSVSIQFNHWEGIKTGIQNECANIFKGRKAKLKRHFDMVGGVNDIEEAKRNPPKRMLSHTWVELIDKLFATREHANRCAKNKENRAKQLYGSYHGIQSLANRRYKDVKETGHANYVKGWEEMHHKKGKWINEKASQDWNKIANKYNESLKKSNGNKALVNELECFIEALGPMRSHIKGVGRKLKSVTPDP